MNRLKLLLLAGITLLVTACGSAPTVEEAPAPQYWPAPPALPRFVHEFTLRNSLDIHRYTDDEQMVRMLTGENPDGHSLVKPFAIAARKGRIYVTDTAINLVHVFDMTRRRYFRMGYRFEGRLIDPRGIAVDEQGRVYVVDNRPARVVVYDPVGLFIKELLLGEDVVRPTGIEVSPDGKRVYVVDTGGVETENHRVIALNADGQRQAALGSRGREPGSFNLPVDVEMDEAGLLYVLDSGNFRVQVFSEDQLVRTWGEVGNGLGQLARPRSIAIGPSGNIFISDSQFTNVQIFNPQGRLLLPIGKREFEDKDGYLSLVAGVDVDETGRLYVIDQKFRKIEVYRPVQPVEGRRILDEYSRSPKE